MPARALLGALALVLALRPAEGRPSSAMTQRVAGVPTDGTHEATTPLKAMLHIDWRRVPDIPVGTQDSMAGVLGGEFIIALGNRGTPGTREHAGQGGMCKPPR